MTYELDIELDDPLEAAFDDIVGEVEEAIENIRKYHKPHLVHTVDVDVHDLLADHQAIAIVWDVSHVKDQRPDLSEEQAWQVLQAVEHDRLNDPMLETIRHVADNLYPIGKESLRRRVKTLLGEIDALPDREADDPAAYGETAAKLDAIEMNVKGA